MLTLRPNWHSTTLTEIAYSIREIGLERCVLQTDLGQKDEPNLVKGFMDFAQQLSGMGFSPTQLHELLGGNAARMLQLGEEG